MIFLSLPDSAENQGACAQRKMYFLYQRGAWLLYGALLFRDEAKEAREEAHVLECLRAYMKNRKKYITSQELMDKYMKQE